MITYKLIPSQITEIDTVTCDKCKKKIKGIVEEQEAHYIDFIGGYGSVFGDGSHVQCDLCQGCLLELIEDYYRYE